MKHQSLITNYENHREVTKILNYIVEKDESIIEKESFQIIVDFKWDSYAQKFFSVQLGHFLHNCIYFWRRGCQQELTCIFERWLKSSNPKNYIDRYFDSFCNLRDSKYRDYQKNILWKLLEFYWHDTNRVIYCIYHNIIR